MKGVIKRVTALENFILEAEFTSGIIKQYDMKPVLNEIEAFSEMKENPELFQKVAVDTGGYGVVWNERLDLASEEIWDYGISIK